MNISRGIKVSPQKVVIYGPEGIGKSTFGSRFPRPLFLDVEGGTKHIDVARWDPAPASWTALLECVDEFLRERPTEFSTLVLDTADWAEQMCTKHVCDKNQKDGVESFGYGKGYVYVAEEFGKLLNKLGEVIAAGYNVVILAHAKMRKFEQPDELGAYDRWEMKLSKNVAPMVKEWADMVLFANYKTMVITTGEGKNTKAKAQGQGKRVIYTTHHSCWDAKNRHGLPDEIPMDYGQIAHCIPDGHTAQPVTGIPATETKNPETGIPVSEQPAPDMGNPISEPPAPTEPAPGAKDGLVFAGPEVPAALAQLMVHDKIMEDEVRAMIGRVGHFAGDTPWKVLQEKGYIDGYIIPNWGYFKEQIESDPNRLPF